MPEYLAPGVHVEESSYRSKSIDGVSTSVSAFVGPALRGPTDTVPDPITGVQAFEQVYGGLDDLKYGPNYLAHAVRAYFDNGGQKLYVARVADSGAPPGRAAYEAALAQLKDLDEVSTIAAPGHSAYPDCAGIQQALVAWAEAPGSYRFAVLDPPPGQSFDGVLAARGQIDSRNAALYYPWVVAADPRASTGSGSREITLPPSGYICGIYARTDIERGVYQAPANAVVQGALRFEQDVTDADQGKLNPAGVNCLRCFRGRGCLVWGARTASSSLDWRYVNVRRYFNYLEDSIERGTRWAVFEPNAEPLWSKVRQAIGDFLFNEWKTGALLGAKPEDAYVVQCGRGSMTQEDIDSGRLVCTVSAAILRPAEFIVFQIVQKTAGAAS